MKLNKSYNLHTYYQGVIQIKDPVLCRQKEFVFSLGLFNQEKSGSAMENPIIVFTFRRVTLLNAAIMKAAIMKAAIMKAAIMKAAIMKAVCNNVVTL